MTSHRELRCPECRILVNMKVEDLPPNVLLMRILGGLKSTPPEVPPSSTPSSTTVNHTVRSTSTEAKLDQQRPAPLPGQAKLRNGVEPENAQSPPHPPAQQIILPRPPVVGAPMPHKHLPQNVCHAKALFDFHSNVTG